MSRWILALLLAGCTHALPPSMTPGEVTVYHTADGWTNPLRRYPADGPPVLLVHGMSANHYNFDFRPEVSLAAALQDAGWDTWIVELRGDPGTKPPIGHDGRGITFDDHAILDLPAAVDAVLAATGETQLSWVGHSMGGMLLYTALSQYPEKIAAGVAISSPATFEHGLRIHRTASRAGFLAKGDGVLPTRGLGRTFTDLGLAHALERRLASRDAISTPMLRGMAYHVLWPVPKPVARQALDWISTKTLTKLDGTPWVQPSDVPLLVMAGPNDGIVAEPDVAAACAVYSHCVYRQLSVAGGFSHDYGHIDPVVGRTARIEVFPRVHAFLAEQWNRREAAAVTEAVAVER